MGCSLCSRHCVNMFKGDLIQFSQELCQIVLLSHRSRNRGSEVKPWHEAGRRQTRPQDFLPPLGAWGPRKDTCWKCRFSEPNGPAGSEAGRWGLEVCVHFSLRATALAMLPVWSDESQLLWGVGACSLGHPNAAPPVPLSRSCAGCEMAGLLWKPDES